MAQTATMIDKISYESSFYVGVIFMATIYGIYLGLTFMIVKLLIYHPSVMQPSRSFYLMFEAALFVIGTMAIIDMPLLGQLMWIVHREQVDPYTFYSEKSVSNDWYIVTGNLGQAIFMFLGDAFLIYRCHIVFGSRLKVIALPLLCSIGYLVSYILRFALPNTTRNRLYTNISSITLVVLVNPMVTTMISLKILAAIRHSPRKSGSNIGKPLANVFVILIESAAPWTILGVLVLIVDWLHLSITRGGWRQGFYLVWCAVGLISPQLVILRVAMSVAWEGTTAAEITQLSTIPVQSFPHIANSQTQSSRIFSAV